jgi:hypothetical protein
VRSGRFCGGRGTENWWAWVDLNHRPHPYQLSKGHLRRSAMACYLVGFPRQYKRFPSPRLSYQVLPVLIERGHKTGHSRVVRNRGVPGRGQASGSCWFFLFSVFFVSRTDRSRVPNEPRTSIVVELAYRSTLSSIQMPPDSSAMVNTSLSWVSDIPTGGIHRGIISRGFSNCDT